MKGQSSINYGLDADEFLEIANNVAYPEYDLWSQIGGIVGIFLGYSILQVTFENCFQRQG